MQTPQRCHIAACAALGGVPIKARYDRTKTLVTGKDDDGHIVYNRPLLALARHYGFHPRARRPYRAKTKESWSAPSALSARTSSWRGASAISGA